MNKKDTYKRSSLVGAALLACMIFLSFQPSKAEEGKLTVIELFTSQGCSSCPPADALLGMLAKRPDILALTLPVDYWDYIGWKDTFAKPQYTQRQRSYARTQNKFQIYTPQLMINGVVDAVGSNRKDIERKITHQKHASQTGVSLSAKKSENGYALSLSSKKTNTNQSTLWLAAYQKKASVEIGRGENRGREVTYTNIVHKLTAIGTWNGGQQTYKIANSDVAGKDIDGAAIFLQQGQTGQIIAAHKLPL